MAHVAQWRCSECSGFLVRKMISIEATCDNCDADIEPRTRRLTCQNIPCNYHICNTCKTNSEQHNTQLHPTTAYMMTSEPTKRGHPAGETPETRKETRTE
eukprot:1525455-Karenia_brevis.AAC.1